MEKDIFCQYDKIKEDVIYRSNHFFVKIGFGLVAAGQVMLIPLEHYDSFAELPLEFNPE